MTEGERLRLFVAIDIPQDHLRRLDEAAAQLKAKYPSGRWTPIESQHVTVKFLGSALADTLDEIAERVATVAADNVVAMVALDRVGNFPGGKRMRVLWVGLDDPENLTPRLAAGLDDALGPLGFEPEKRDFTPHLTLARFKTPQRLDESLALPSIPREPFSVDELILYRSRLSPKGARYEALSRFSLRPAP